MAAPRVLVLHNRYRIEGGEERSVALHLRALERANVAHRLLERESGGTSEARAAAAVVRGGDDPAAIGDEVREFGADVVHAHNIQPLIGPRGLEAARDTGA